MPLISAGRAFYSKTDMMAGGSGLVALDGPTQVWVECRDALGVRWRGQTHGCKQMWVREWARTHHQHPSNGFKSAVWTSASIHNSQFSAGTYLKSSYVSIRITDTGLSSQ